MIVVEDEGPYEVAASTPLPQYVTTQRPLLRQQCLRLKQNLFVRQNGADFQGQLSYRLPLIVLLLVGSRDRELNLLGLITSLGYKATVNLFYFPQVLNYHT